MLNKKVILFQIVFIAFVNIFFTACDTNLLGGSKSKIDQYFEPGKRTPSLPPTISPIADFVMDENDIQYVPFTINDPDTFMMCSTIFVKAYSSNETLIDSGSMMVTGAYPNCTLKLQPKALQFGVSSIRVELWDFWTVVSATFNLTVNHVMTPGLFSIVNAEAQNRAALIEWSIPAYMTGTSSRYTIFYRPTGSSAPYSQITPVRTPYVITGLVNGVTYDVFVRARNSIGYRDSNIVQVTPTRYKLYGSEYVASSDQQAISTTTGRIKTYSSSGPKSDGVEGVTTASGKYKVYLNSQGNIISGANP